MDVNTDVVTLARDLPLRRDIMNKLIVAISTLVAMTVVFANNAFADIAHGGGGGGGGGCSVVSTHPGALAFLMVTVGIVALTISRRRK
jgi:hypothetical protein